MHLRLSESLCDLFDLRIHHRPVVDQSFVGAKGVSRAGGGTPPALFFNDRRISRRSTRTAFSLITAGDDLDLVELTAGGL